MSSNKMKNVLNVVIVEQDLSCVKTKLDEKEIELTKQARCKSQIRMKELKQLEQKLEKREEQIKVKEAMINENMKEKTNKTSTPKLRLFRTSQINTFLNTKALLARQLYIKLIIIGGDFNEDIFNGASSQRKKCINDFMQDHELSSKEIGLTFIHSNGKDVTAIDFILYQNKYSENIIDIQKLNATSNVSDNYPILLSVPHHQKKLNTYKSQKHLIKELNGTKLIQENMQVTFLHKLAQQDAKYKTVKT
ncbi:Hypothetical predicted protein, partial [Mytilus galloprovincialis]